MPADAIHFLGLLLMALLVGTVFGVRLGFDPAGEWE